MKKQMRSLKKLDDNYRQLQKQLSKLEEAAKQLLKLMKEHNKNQISIAAFIAKVESGYDTQTGAAAGGSSQDQLLNATKQMQQTQMSFNLQYLQLQSQMQQENRSYTAISNIMKTKHDTVKNSISNIR